MNDRIKVRFNGRPIPFEFRFLQVSRGVSRLSVLFERQHSFINKIAFPLPTAMIFPFGFIFACTQFTKQLKSGNSLWDLIKQGWF